MWKILTEQIGKEIYYSLVSRGLFAEEQKGYRKGTKGIGELLCIDAQREQNETKTYRIDYKTHSISSHIMYKIADDVIKFI